MIKKLADILPEKGLVAVVGHQRPDGDCIGSTLGVYFYLKEIAPELQVQVLLDPVHPRFSLIPGVDTVKQELPEGVNPDYLIVCDCSTKDRIGAGSQYAELDIPIAVIDHHLTDGSFGTYVQICSEISSASEVLYNLLDPERITPEAAACMYMGMYHDTGCFRYSSTTGDTLRAAAFLMDKGILFTEIVEKTFFAKSYSENRMAGYVLEHAVLELNGQILVGSATIQEMEEMGADTGSLDAIVAQLNQTSDIQACMFLYEIKPGIFKVSLRSQPHIHVNEIAGVFGGGGHAQAAGCQLEMPLEEAKKLVLAEFAKHIR